MDHPCRAALHAASSPAAAAAGGQHLARLGGDPEARAARGRGVRVARAVRGGIDCAGRPEVIILIAVGAPSGGLPTLVRAAELAVAPRPRWWCCTCANGTTTEASCGMIHRRATRSS